MRHPKTPLCLRPIMLLALAISSEARPEMARAPAQTIEPITSHLQSPTNTCSIKMADVNAVIDAIRNQLIGIYRMQDQVLNANKVQAWLASSNTVLDLDPQERKILIRIISGSPMPVRSAPQPQRGGAKLIDTEGLIGIQFFADAYVLNAVRDLSCDQGAHFHQSIVKMSDVLIRHLYARKGLSVVPDSDRSGLGLIFKAHREDREKKEEDERFQKPPECAKSIWDLSGSFCLALGKNLAILPCAYHDRLLMEMNLPTLDSHKPVHPGLDQSNAWVGVQCAVGSADFAARLVFTFSVPKSSSLKRPPQEPCAVGDFGCNTDETLAPFRHR